MVKISCVKTLLSFGLALACFTANAQEGELYTKSSYFNDGLLTLTKPTSQGKRVGVVDVDGKVVVPFEYTGVSPFSSGLAVVNKPVVDEGGRKTSLAGFVDKEGKEVIACEYGRVCMFNEDGLALATTTDAKHFLLNTKGERLVQFNANFIDYTIKNGFIPYSDNNKTWGFMNLKGEKLTPCIYEKAFLGQSQWGGFADYLAVRRDGKWGLINRQGKEIVECKYYDIIYPSNEKSGSIIMVKIEADMRSPFKMIHVAD